MSPGATRITGFWYFFHVPCRVALKVVFACYSSAGTLLPVKWGDQEAPTSSML